MRHIVSVLIAGMVMWGISNVSVAQKPEIPLIDRRMVSKFETATFGLG